MERTMIKTRGGVFYKVPEEMFPFAAQNQVDNGMAEWVERAKPTLLDKAKKIVSDAKQASHQRVETAALNRSVVTAARRLAPARVIVDTDELFGDDTLDFSRLE